LGQAIAWKFHQEPENSRRNRAQRVAGTAAQETYGSQSMGSNEVSGLWCNMQTGHSRHDPTR